MIIEKNITESRELPLFADLKRCRLTYRIYKYIERMGKCIINDIRSNTGANLKTIYRNIEMLQNEGFIRKDFSSEMRKDGAHFFVIARPALKIELSKIKTIIERF